MHRGDCGGGLEFNRKIAIGDGIERIGRRSIKAERGARGKAVDREGRARQGRGTERVFVKSGPTIGKARSIAPDHLHIGKQMMAERDRLGDLQMGIARHHRGRVAFGLFDQGMLQRLELSIMPIDGVANPKAKIRRDLIVARSGGMQPPRRGTNQIGQSAFDIHMNIFERVLEDKIPGLNLACPSNGADAAMMLRECVRLAREEQRLVVFVEPIALYPMRDLHGAGDGGWMRQYPAPDQRITFGEVGVSGQGQDIAIITFGNGVYLATQAQARLAAQGIAARIIDIRWLSPLPEAAIIAAIEGCKVALIVDETRRTGGLAEALMAMLAERSALPPLQHYARLTAQDSFIATGPAYAATMPSAEDIVAAARALVEGQP